MLPEILMFHSNTLKKTPQGTRFDSCLCLVFMVFVSFRLISVGVSFRLLFQLLSCPFLYLLNQTNKQSGRTLKTFHHNSARCINCSLRSSAITTKCYKFPLRDWTGFLFIKSQAHEQFEEPKLEAVRENNVELVQDILKELGPLSHRSQAADELVRILKEPHFQV